MRKITTTRHLEAARSQAGIAVRQNAYATDSATTLRLQTGIAISFICQDQTGRPVHHGGLHCGALVLFIAASMNNVVPSTTGGSIEACSA